MHTALALGLAAAVSLGLARFSYAPLLPMMRADLGWSYFTGGSMELSARTRIPTALRAAKH